MLLKEGCREWRLPAYFEHWMQKGSKQCGWVRLFWQLKTAKVGGKSVPTFAQNENVGAAMEDAVLTIEAMGGLTRR